MSVASRVTVVIVEDNVALCESLELLMQVEGYNWRSYASAEAYLEAAPPKPPYCLLLDLRLPGMSGLALQKRLRTDQPGLSLIFLSANASEAEVHQARAGGAAGFFHKPFDTEPLLACMARILV